MDIAVGEASIRYEERGSGPPVLLLAPGGMSSTADRWAAAPFDPREALADAFQLVAMDQRHAGASDGPLDAADPWGSYAGDQLGLADRLGLDRFGVIGMCIGCAFALRLAELAPGRVTAAVLLQPIGVLDSNRAIFDRMWQDWRDALLERRGDLTATQVNAFGTTMWADTGFVGSVSREAVRSLRTPLLVMPGVDEAHPASVAHEVAALAPDAELWEPWRSSPERVAETVDRVREFLRAHAA